MKFNVELISGLSVVVTLASLVQVGMHALMHTSLAHESTAQVYELLLR